MIKESHSEKSAILVVCHKPIPYVAKLANSEINSNFYIHVDRKADIDIIKKDFAPNLENVFWLEKRVDVNWGGFSIVQSILSLMRVALENKENLHFHLISGNCIFLDDITLIEKRMKSYPESSIFLELSSSLRRRYRLRFNAPHADTKYQRSIIGRLLTKCFQLIDKLVYPRNELIKLAPFGNMWFSANIEGMKQLLSIVTEDEETYFSHKLVPDEHFFQYLILKNGLQDTVYDNKRYIKFIGSANHPENLNYGELVSLERSKYWIARKVSSGIALNYLENIKKDCGSEY
ncbi:beta-1,6-N-acetylglucosaminyltransferase [Mannheimia haemolytica]|uniref:beta-1,6-N-acetylglucosaminyltransferase n=1 Tax=Mannheimia haemolytica TaxID=75985 RepID=UPI001558AF6A|nr:beta-1,6-N-acetylglucosaminyltransferase [Mannheimia haemolytica]UQX67352.1 beta-1,6-N-acetylglucosaminyltransferase [Mannheimia haemolytica]